MASAFLSFCTYMIADIRSTPYVADDIRKMAFSGCIHSVLIHIHISRKSVCRACAIQMMAKNENAVGEGEKKYCAEFFLHASYLIHSPSSLHWLPTERPRDWSVGWIIPGFPNGGRRLTYGTLSTAFDQIV